MILAARDLEKRFDGRAVLRNASLELRPGEIVLLEGRNGSGKTTLGRILATALAPDRGTVTLDEKPVRRKLREARRAIGFATHRPLLYLGLTPLENLELFGKLAGVKDARARAAALMERFGLSEFNGVSMEHFSRGMLQRVALGRALLPEPRVLILDEPYAGLDEPGVRTLNAILDEARKRGAAILVISHDRERVASLATRTCALRNG
ncbi:MAG TPA: heme ABC exporter ATP-binding protein CcmA, partial [Candidatus Polarisedimenticolia bacterium]|nr:heme ABC exporter ATP-binding protein CcmA [Candidatus Polarisedimenticolia bacterium]